MHRNRRAFCLIQAEGLQEEGRLPQGLCSQRTPGRLFSDLPGVVCLWRPHQPLTEPLFTATSASNRAFHSCGHQAHREQVYKELFS